jgi:transcriptional regulator with XRE-family HTH domain
MAAEGPLDQSPTDDDPYSAASRVFATNLRRERRRQCRSMRGLAEAAGMHASEISRLERGLRDPRLSTMLRVAMALEVPLVSLFARPEAPAEPRSQP